MTNETTEKKEGQTRKEYARAYAREYYKKHRELISDRNRIKYFNTRKKTPQCKKCGVKLPKYMEGHTKYCDKCIAEKSHGREAHNMASVRYYRKKHLTRKINISII